MVRIDMSEFQERHTVSAWSARLQAMLATRRQASSPRPCGAGPTLCCF